MIYLDHNATTPVRPEAFEAMLPFLGDEFGNASSVHQAGQRARKAVEIARERLATFIKADSPDEVVFTSGGTEANNTVFRGILETAKGKKGRVVSSPIEHSSVRTPLQHFGKIGEIDNVVVPVQPNGIVKVQDIEDAVTDNTILVSVMLANNEIGTLQPIKDISKICRKKNVLLHTDAVQVAGKHAIDVNDLGVDFLSLSGHKFGSPKGTGILYIRKGSRMAGLILGGKQEKNRRGGTENVPGIVAMGAAAESSMKEMPTEASRIQKLRDLFESLVLKDLLLVSINGDTTQRTCNTSNICFEYTDSSELLMALDLQGVASSTGSACQAGSAEASHVLLAMGLPQEKAHGSLRFSLGHSTREDEIRSAAKIIVDTVNRIREKNPLWKEKRLAS